MEHTRTPRLQKRHIERPHRRGTQAETYCGLSARIGTAVLSARGELVSACCGDVLSAAQVCTTCAARATAFQRAQRRAA